MLQMIHPQSLPMVSLMERPRRGRTTTRMADCSVTVNRSSVFSLEMYGARFPLRGTCLGKNVNVLIRLIRLRGVHKKNALRSSGTRFSADIASDVPERCP